MYSIGVYQYRLKRKVSRYRPVRLVIATVVTGLAGFYVLQQTSAESYTGSEQADGGQAVAGANDAASERLKVKSGDGMAVQAGLLNQSKKEIAMRLVSSAENSSLEWRAQFQYIEDIGDGRGYTAGIIGFCSGTGDMLELVEQYTATKPDNLLAKYLPALRKVNGTDSHAGLGAAFENDWRIAAGDTLFQQAQEFERDRVYFNPSVNLAVSDGLRTLGQFIYYDAAVMHGPDAWGGGLPDIRQRVLSKVQPPAKGGDETTYLNAFLDERAIEMRKEAAHDNVDRVEKQQRAFLNQSNYDLDAPLRWTMYGDPFSILSNP